MRFASFVRLSGTVELKIATWRQVSSNWEQQFDPESFKIEKDSFFNFRSFACFAFVLISCSSSDLILILALKRMSRNLRVILGSFLHYISLFLSLSLNCSFSLSLLLSHSLSLSLSHLIFFSCSPCISYSPLSLSNLIILCRTSLSIFICQ